MSRLAHMGVMALVFALLFKAEFGFGPLGWRFLSDSDLAAYAGIALTAAGIALAIYARVSLGRNWSAVVSIKEDHQLVSSGPYAFVRHPIYSGLLLAMLGTAIAFGEVRGLIGLALATWSFWKKSRLEEQFMVQEFGSDYVQYRMAVKALIPFVL